MSMVPAMPPVTARVPVMSIHAILSLFIAPVVVIVVIVLAQNRSAKTENDQQAGHDCDPQFHAFAFLGKFYEMVGVVWGLGTTPYTIDSSDEQ
jgi:hypothetical protein